jgi:hypothetical protein
VRDSRTRNPYFSPKSWRSQDFVLEEQINGLNRDEVLRLAIRRIEEEDEDKPLWHVIRYVAQSGKAYLAISGQHELMDGQGLMRLAQAITSDDISQITTEVFDAKVGMAGPDYQPSIGFFFLSYIEKRLSRFYLLGYHLISALIPLGHRLSINTQVQSLGISQFSHSLLKLLKASAEKARK